MNRIIQDKITELKDNEVFVFGSNTAGRHGKGAAKQALTWGAIWGQGDGLQGRTYGIPTKDSKIRTLPINQIKPFVDKFIQFAKEHPTMIFLVSEVGCGLAGYKPKDIAPLFKEAEKLENVKMSERFWHKIINNYGNIRSEKLV
jgi:hypothetical protein